MSILDQAGLGSFRSASFAVEEHTSYVETLRRYYGIETGVEPYTGSCFDAWTQRDPGPPFVFTPRDLLAVQALGVDIPPRAAEQILGSLAGHLSDLLRRAPKVSLNELDHDLNEDEALQGLWNTLRGIEGLGRTKTSKLIAAKLPRLVPVTDEVVGARTGTSESYWTPYWTEFRHTSPALWSNLELLRDQAGVDPTVSPLRVFDVLIWMS